MVKNIGHIVKIIVLNSVLCFGVGAQIAIEKIGTYNTTLGEGSAEVSAYDSLSKRLFVINSDFASFSIIDLSDPTKPTIIQTIDLSNFGSGPTSVAVNSGLVAVAVEAAVSTDAGVVRFYNANGLFLRQFTVGALPDMVVFNNVGSMLLVANEGEEDDGVDPKGSVSIIDLTDGIGNAVVKTLDFTIYDPLRNNKQRGLPQLPQDVIIFPKKLPSEDLEPEYIAVSPDDSEAYVTLQENNAVAVIDLTTQTLREIQALGFKDHSVINNELDPSDKDGKNGEGVININTWPVLGMYQPDGIASISVDGQNYYLTANEGDSRDEDTRIKNLTLNPAIFPNAAALQQDDQLGRLQASEILGLTPVNPVRGNPVTYDELYVYGGRSFSIWNSQTGTQVYDSGSDFEMQTAIQVPDIFNSNGGSEGSFDGRSDNKGPEPEGIVTGMVNGKAYVFVGLERVGGFMVYDVSDPLAPNFERYQPSTDGDEAPEGLLFIPDTDSPNGHNLLLVSHEDTGTVAIYQIESDIIFSNDFEQN